MEKVLRLGQTQEERVRKEDNTKRKWAQKREAVPIPSKLKAWRRKLSFPANTFIRAFPERWWVAQGYPHSQSCFCVSWPGGRLGGMTCLFRHMVSPWWSLQTRSPGLLLFLLEMQHLILNLFF